jgi:hypothetical protein
MAAWRPAGIPRLTRARATLAKPPARGACAAQRFVHGRSDRGPQRPRGPKGPKHESRRSAPPREASGCPVSVGAPLRARGRVDATPAHGYSETTVARVIDIVAMSIIDMSLPETSLVSAPIARVALSASR